MRSSPFVDFTSVYHSGGHGSVTDSDGKAEKGKLNKLRTERAGKQEKDKRKSKNFETGLKSISCV